MLAKSGIAPEVYDYLPLEKLCLVYIMAKCYITVPKRFHITRLTQFQHDTRINFMNTGNVFQLLTVMLIVLLKA